MEYNDPSLDLMAQQVSNLRPVTCTARCCSTVIEWDPPLPLTLTSHPDDPDELIWELSLTGYPQVSGRGETLKDACVAITGDLCWLATEDPADPTYTEHYEGVVAYLRSHVGFMILTVPETCKVTEVRGSEIVLELK